MLVFESIKIVAHNLARHKLRTTLTLLGMIFGVAAVLAMLSIGAGAEREALSLIEKMGLRNIIIRAKEFERDQLEILRQDSPGLTLRDVESLKKALPAGSLVIGKKRLKSYQVRVTRNQPERAELLGEVRDRLVFTGRARRPPLEFIGRQRSDMLQKRVGVDPLHPIAARLRRWGLTSQDDK